MSTAQRTIFLVLVCAALLLASSVIVFAAEEQDDGDGNLQCPSVPSLYVYVSGVKYGEKVGDKVNLYGKKCVDLENKDIAAQGHCVGPKNCRADLCDGKPCALPKLKIEDVRRAVYEGASPTPTTPVPPSTPGSLLDQWMFNPAPLPEQKAELPPSANSVGEVLNQSDTQPGFVDKARESIGNFFFPQKSLNDTAQLQGRTMSDVESQNIKTTRETGGTAGVTGFGQTPQEEAPQPSCDGIISCVKYAWGKYNPFSTSAEAADQTKTVVASTYGWGGKDSADQPIALGRGETLSNNPWTIAEKSGPLGERFMLTNPETGQSVVVARNDRAPFDARTYADGRSIDVSRPAAESIGMGKTIASLTITPVPAGTPLGPVTARPPAVYDLYGESTGSYTAAEGGFRKYDNERVDIAVNAINWDSYVVSDAQYDPTADPALANLDWIGSDAQPQGAESENLTPQQIAVREGLMMDERMRQAEEEARRAGLDPDAPPLAPGAPRTVAEIEAEVAKNKAAGLPVELATPAPPEVKPSGMAEVYPSLSDGPVAPQEGGSERVAVLSDAQVEQKVRLAFDQKIKDARGTVRYAEELLARSESPAAREAAQIGLDEANKRLNAVVEGSISYSAGNPSPELQKVIERIRTGDDAGAFSRGLTALADTAHSGAKTIGDNMPTSADITDPSAIWKVPAMVLGGGAWGIASGVGLVAESGRNLLEKLDVVGFRVDTDRELSAAIDPIGAEWKTAADVAVVAPFGVGIVKSTIGAGVDAGIEAGASVTRSFLGDVAQSDARVVVRDSAGFTSSLERGAIAVEDTNVARTIAETPRPISPTEIEGPFLPRAANIDAPGGTAARTGGTIDDALAKFEGAANDAKSLGSAEPSVRTAPPASDKPFLQGADRITGGAAREAEAPRPSTQGIKDASAEIDRIAADARAAAEAAVPETPPTISPTPSTAPDIGDYVPIVTERWAFNDIGNKKIMTDWTGGISDARAAEISATGRPRLELVVDNTKLPRPSSVEPPTQIVEEARIAAGGELPVPLPEPPPVRTADLRVMREEPPAPPELVFTKLDVPSGSPIHSAETVSASELTPDVIATMKQTKAPEGYTYMYRGIDRSYATPVIDQQFTSSLDGALGFVKNSTDGTLIRVAVPDAHANPFNSPYAIDRIGNFKTPDVFGYPRSWFTSEVPYHQTPEFQAFLNRTLPEMPEWRTGKPYSVVTLDEQGFVSVVHGVPESPVSAAPVADNLAVLRQAAAEDLALQERTAADAARQTKNTPASWAQNPNGLPEPGPAGSLTDKWAEVDAAIARRKAAEAAPEPVRVGEPQPFPSEPMTGRLADAKTPGEAVADWAGGVKDSVTDSFTNARNKIRDFFTRTEAPAVENPVAVEVPRISDATPAPEVVLAPKAALPDSLEGTITGALDQRPPLSATVRGPEPAPRPVERPTVVLAEEAQIDNPFMVAKPAPERPTVVLAEEAQIDNPIVRAVSDVANVPAVADNRTFIQRGWEYVFGKNEPKAAPVVEDVVPLGDGAPSIGRDFEIPKSPEVAPATPKADVRPGPGEVGASNPTLADAAISDLRGPASKFELNPAAAAEVKAPVEPAAPPSLRERFAAWLRGDAKTTSEIKPVADVAPSAAEAAPVVSAAEKPSLIERAGSWVGDNKGKAAVFGVGGFVGIGAISDGVKGIFGGGGGAPPPAGRPGGGKTPAGAIVPDKKEKEPNAPPAPPPPGTRQQPCGPNDTYASSGCYPPYSGPDDSTESTSLLGRIGSMGGTLSQLLGKMFGSSSPAPAQQPTPTVPVKPPTTPPTTTPPTPPKPFATLIAEPAAVLSGKKSQLIWSSVNTSSCGLFAPGNIPIATGTRGSTSTLALATTTRFTLNCSAPSGATASAEATVTVQ